MESKVIVLFTFGLLMLFLFTSVVSAASLSIPSTSIIIPPSVDHDGGTFEVTFDLENSGLADTLSWSTSMTSGSSTLVSTSVPISIADGSSSTVTVPVTAVFSYSAHQSGTLVGSITVTPDTSGSAKTVAFSIPIEVSSELSLTDALMGGGETTAEMTLKNEGNTALSNIEFTFSTIEGVVIATNLTNNILTSLIAGDDALIELLATISESLLLGSNEVTLTATASDGTSTTSILTIQNDYCSNGPIGDLKISDLDFQNDGQFGKDDEWYLLNEIEVQVEVENTNKDDAVDDVVIEWGLYNTKTGEFIVDDDLSEFNLDEDEEETKTFTFTLDPDDFDQDDNENDFVFYVKAYSDDKDSGEHLQCAEDSQDIKIVRDSHFVVSDNIQMPEVAQCGAIVEGSLKVWNIGDEDEEDVSVFISNSNLDLNKKIEVGDVDTLDDSKVDFSFEVPIDATGSYPIKFQVLDDEDDPFETDDDDASETNRVLEVQCGSKEVSSIVIDASLESEAVAGKELVVKATITNTGTDATLYQVLATNYDGWATLKSIESKSFTLAPNESENLRVILLPNKDASGDQDFILQVVYAGTLTEKVITVPIQSSQKSSSITGAAIGENIRENWFIWLIALINVILVILIIVVAVRMASK